MLDRISQFESGELSRQKLYWYYMPELNSLKNAKNRPYATVHPKIRDKVEFLRVVAKIGPRKSPEYSLDRVDNLNYEYHPDHLRWANQREQAENRSSTRVLIAFDANLQTELEYTLPEWAERRKLPLATIHKRLSSGWSPEEAVFIPLYGRRRDYSFEARQTLQRNHHHWIMDGFSALARLRDLPLDYRERNALRSTFASWIYVDERPAEVLEYLFSRKLDAYFTDQGIQVPKHHPTVKYMVRNQSEILLGFRIRKKEIAFAKLKARESPPKPNWKELDRLRWKEQAIRDLELECQL